MRGVKKGSLISMLTCVETEPFLNICWHDRFRYWQATIHAVLFSYKRWMSSSLRVLLAISSLFIELICMRRTNPRIKLFSHQRHIYLLHPRTHTHSHIYSTNERLLIENLSLLITISKFILLFIIYDEKKMAIYIFDVRSYLLVSYIYIYNVF